jgi:methylated-DNA-[protein]-cysteine S-methyltransferase
MPLDPIACYKLLSQIPKGKVTSYKEVAKALNSKSYRAVGGLIGRNPNAPEVPCHRVVTSDGLLGGYAFGVDKKIEILKNEGVTIRDGKVENFKEIFYKFD